MGVVIIHHKVQDYEAWSPAFDDHEAVRNAAGLTNARVYRLAEDANNLVVILDMADRRRAEEFAASDDLRSRMRDAGVIGRPEIHYVE